MQSPHRWGFCWFDYLNFLLTTEQQELCQPKAVKHGMHFFIIKIFFQLLTGDLHTDCDHHAAISTLQTSRRININPISDELTVCVSRRRPLINKQEANYFKGNIQKSVTDQLDHSLRQSRMFPEPTLWGLWTRNLRSVPSEHLHLCCSGCEEFSSKQFALSHRCLGKCAAFKEFIGMKWKRWIKSPEYGSGLVIHNDIAAICFLTISCS